MACGFGDQALRNMGKKECLDRAFNKKAEAQKLSQPKLVVARESLIMSLFLL